MFKRTITRLIIIASVQYCSIHCAVQVPPSGGPVDTIPPSIVETSPSDGETMVPIDSDFLITFSEAMDRESVQSALFISPTSQSEHQYSWKRNSLKITFSEPLNPAKRDRTYIIRIGSSAKDRHNVALERTFTSAFSTGETIDNGMIPGKVFSDKEGADVQGAANAVIRAYKLDETSDPNPILFEGDYITQADGEGNFQLTHLSSGTYRVFAITNDDKDISFSITTDRIGMPPGDITLDVDEESNPIMFKPVSIDTLLPRLYLLEIPDRNHIMLHFDKPIDKHSLSSQNFRIVQLPEGNVVSDAIKAYYFTETSENNVSLYTDALMPDIKYQLIIEHIIDIHGNQLSNYSDSTTIFTCSSREDTSKFFLETMSPADSTKNIPVYTQIVLKFNQPVEITLLGEYFQLVDSLEKLISGEFKALSPAEYHFIPDKSLLSLMTYYIRLNLDSIKSVEGKPLQLLKSEYTFQTTDISRTGALIGEILLTGDSIRAPFMVSLKTKNATHGQSRSIMLDNSRQYEFYGVMPGEYILTAFLDKDNNGEWSAGRLIPYMPAEPFAVYPEEVTIRPGIENMGINLTLYIHSGKR